MISNIHHTTDYKEYCHVGHTAIDCKLGLFQDEDFAATKPDNLRVHIRRRIVHIWRSHICANLVGVVRKTNCGVLMDAQRQK